MATYGQIAKLVPRCTPRMVGFAMAGCPDDVPWHRVVNREGRVSPRADGRPDPRQRGLLQDEGVAFDRRGRVDLHEYGWLPVD